MIPALAAAAALVLSPAVSAQPAHLAPGCHRAVFTENSGEGPTYRVVICYFTHQNDTKWVMTVDGSPLQNGAVIFVPRPRPDDDR